MKIHKHNAGHATKMEITLSKSYFQEPVGRFDETWYEASGIQAHYILFKFGKVKFCNLGFSIGKSENSGFYMGKCDNDRFFGNYCIHSCALEFG